MFFVIINYLGPHYLVMTRGYPLTIVIDQRNKLKVMHKKNVAYAGKYQHHFFN